MESVRATQDEASPNDPPLSPSSHYKREVTLTAKARKPNKGRAFLHSRHTLNEILGADQARALIGSNIQSHIQNSTSQSTPPENQTYSIMLRAMREVTVLVNSLDGMTEVPRSYLDEQLRLLATGAYPDRTNPIQAALWDQYVQLAGDMAANLLQTYNKVITEVNLFCSGVTSLANHLFFLAIFFTICSGVTRSVYYFICFFFHC